MEYERTTHDIVNVNKHVRLADVRTVITFRTQQLLDLWENEMAGQISDGMWENSRNTEWLWRNVYLRLGDKTKVVSAFSYDRKRTSFPLTKDLWEIVGDRIMAESGFRNRTEASAAWREIANAIANWQVDNKLVESVREMGKLVEKDTQARMTAEADALIDELRTESGGTLVRATSSELWVNGTIDDRYWSLRAKLNGNTGYWVFSSPIELRVPEGELKTGLEKARAFLRDIKEIGGYIKC